MNIVYCDCMYYNGKNLIFILLFELFAMQFTKEITESIVGHTVGRIVVGAREATPGSIRDGFIGCVKVCTSSHLSVFCTQ